MSNSMHRAWMMWAIMGVVTCLCGMIGLGLLVHRLVTYATAFGTFSVLFRAWAAGMVVLSAATLFQIGNTAWQIRNFVWKAKYWFYKITTKSTLRYGEYLARFR